MSDAPGWEAVHVDELESIAVAGVVWHPVRRRLGIEAFGMNAYTAEAPGKQIVEEHDESSLGHQEVYVVVRGRVTFTVGGETLDAAAGTIVFIRDPALRRVAVAETEDALVLAVGNAAGRAYEPSPWETAFAAAPLLEAGRFDDALALLADGLREHPGNPSLLYNLACAEARAGRAEEAIAHLREAAGKEPRYAETARSDPDFDAIRGEPGFPV
jgi:quercetin dioxygenase-like cupin family protein